MEGLVWTILTFMWLAWLVIATKCTTINESGQARTKYLQDVRAKKCSPLVKNNTGVNYEFL